MPEVLVDCSGYSASGIRTNTMSVNHAADTLVTVKAVSP